ncbi:MAG: SUMF1/EgtB/PvdO family nonheme iron enzyme [Muribaculaceae bacterium]|nr:SUMF1/EgtB/PvdO family nonheme iron enzyme [Muribaculaceae bacterium]
MKVKIYAFMIACFAALAPFTAICKDYKVNGVSFTMVTVQGGTFTMGATAEQGDDVNDYELPTHKVTLSSFEIGKTEVTQALWKAVMGEVDCFYEGDNLPIYELSWEECQEFITKLNSLTGEKFRLPTEAEWEFAARGGNKSKGYKYAGSNDIDKVAWYSYNSELDIHPVATKAPNELGLFDMSGNVWEWCNDWFEEDYYTPAPQTNPQGPDEGFNDCRVMRGGDCDYHSNPDFDAWLCRVSNREYHRPDDYRAGGYQGLRLAK